MLAVEVDVVQSSGAPEGKRFEIGFVFCPPLRSDIPEFRLRGGYPILNETASLLNTNSNSSAPCVERMIG